jgi:hypothetical protein
MLLRVVPLWWANGVVFHLDEPTLKRAADAPAKLYLSARRARECWGKGKWPCPYDTVPTP